MLKIYYTVEEIFKKEYQDYSKGFKEGFLTCLKLFDIGLRKREDYNLRYRIIELEKENHQLKKIVEKKYSKIKDLEHDLGTTSLISGNPMESFREVLVETETGSFVIVVNLDENTLNACIINFSQRNTWKGMDEAKNKLMQYINSKRDSGFRAYKDANIAKKEGAKML